ncbi:MAG: ATP-binding protein [Thiovulaceae bacterium]|nr:ATP-binding protein [Sulfurimonadaceae bacterium]
MFNSLKSKFIISFVSVEILFLVLISLVNFDSLDKAAKTLTDEKIEVSSQLLTKLLKTPLITYDLATIDDALLDFSSIKNVVAVSIEDADKNTLASHIKKEFMNEKVFYEIIKSNKTVHKDDKYTYLYTTKNITSNSKDLGRIHFIFNSTDSYNSIHSTKQITYIMIVFALAIGLFISFIIGNNLGKSIEQLIYFSKSVSQNKNIKIPYHNNNNDEIGQLFNSMNQMKNTINKRTLELKSSINDLEHFIDALNASAIVSKTDINGVITFVNSKFLKVSGYTLEETIGKTHSILRDPNTDNSFYADMWDIISSKKIFHNTFKNIKKDGSIFYVDATIVPLLDNEDNIKEYIAISYEVTDIIDAKDKALEAKKIKEDFLANMSHEIRTPMNAIIGFTEILKNNIYDKKSTKYINIIQDSSISLLNIINDILDFSKIENGKLQINKHPFKPKEEFKKAVNFFKHQAKEKNINIIYKIDENLPLCLNGDKLRIEQILNNLLSNAIKFTNNDNNIYVDITYDTKLSFLSITVKDEGIGIDKKAQEKIFNAFEQADSSTTRKFGGTGLGLSISNKLANLMDGSITLLSEEDKGSTFKLSLPIFECENTKEIQEVIIENKIDDKIENFQGHILVAEDSKTNQILIKILLADFGLTYDIVENGLEAVEAIKKSTFDLILMDESMPKLTGSQAFKEIRKYEQEQNIPKTPIIALTANVLEDDKSRFLELGMDDFLAKPIDKGQLIRVLCDFLKKG